MKTSSIRTQIYTLNTTNITTSRLNPPFITSIKTTPPYITRRLITSSTHNPASPPKLLKTPQKPLKLINKEKTSNGYSRNLVVGAASLGIALFVMGMDDHNKALAFGPEGPMVEEFWDNVRRYALYALTVSSGAIYTIFVPILELLKNPISAVLVLTIIVGGLFIVSQVVSAMIGVTDFSYDYGY